jgi:protein-disulfide isomerase
MNGLAMGWTRRRVLTGTVMASLGALVAKPVIAQTNSASPVVILVFTAFGCGYSAQADDMLRAVKAKYGRRVQIRYKFLPLDESDDTLKRHEAALFAQSKGKMNEAVSYLHAQNSAVDATKSIATMLEKLDLSAADWQLAQQSGQLRTLLDSDTYDAQALKAIATPTFFVGGFKFEGLQKQEVIEQLVDFQLAGQSRNQSIEQLLGATPRRNSPILDTILAK